MSRGVVAAALVLAPALAACGGGGSFSVRRAEEAPPPAPTRATTFLAAADDLDAEQAAALGTTPAESALARSIALYLAGDLRAAATALPPGDEGAVTERARELRAAALLQLRAWPELARSTTDPGVEALARALAAFPATRSWRAEAPFSLPLGVTFSGGPALAARVEGRATELWIDTGATMTVISESVAADAGVTARGSAVATFGASGAGERVSVGVASVDRLCIGASTVRGLPVAIGGPEIMEAWIAFIPLVKVEGILGWDVLASHDVELDAPGARVTFQPPTDCEDGAPLTWLGMPILRARTETGRPMWMAIDTGVHRSMLTPKGARKLGARPDADRADLAIRVGSTAIEAAGLAIEPPPRGNVVLDGVLGSGAFTRAKLRLNAPRRCAEIVPIEDPDRPTGRSRPPARPAAARR